VLHHASRNVLPETRRYRPKAYCKEGGAAAEAETSDGLLELLDAIGLVRQQLVAAQLEGRRVVAGKVATFAVGKVTLELTGEIKKTIGGSGEAKFWALTANAEAERTSGVRTHDHRRVALEALEAGPYVAALLPTATPSRPARAAVRPGAGVATLLLEGLSYAQIANALFVTRSTAGFYLSNLYAKTSTSSRQELAQLLRPSRRTPDRVVATDHCDQSRRRRWRPRWSGQQGRSRRGVM
jgi:hypothetical protein